MLSTILRPWEDIMIKGEIKTENQDKGFRKPAILEEV